MAVAGTAPLEPRPRPRASGTRRSRSTAAGTRAAPPPPSRSARGPPGTPCPAWPRAGQHRRRPRTASGKTSRWRRVPNARGGRPFPAASMGWMRREAPSGSGAAKDASNTRIRGTSPTLTASPRSSSSAVVCSFSGENAAWVERPSSSFTGASSSSAKDRSSNSFEGCSSTTRSGTSASSSSSAVARGAKTCARSRGRSAWDSERRVKREERVRHSERSVECHRAIDASRSRAFGFAERFTKSAKSKTRETRVRVLRARSGAKRTPP